MKLLPAYLRGSQVGQVQKRTLLGCLDAIKTDDPRAAESFVDALEQLIQEAFAPDQVTSPEHTPC